MASAGQRGALSEFRFPERYEVTCELERFCPNRYNAYVVLAGFHALLAALAWLFVVFGGLAGAAGATEPCRAHADI